MSSFEPLLAKPDKRKVGIVNAAWKLEDALNDRLVEHYPSAAEARELHCEAAQADKDFVKVLMCFVVLTFLESPPWCDNDNNVWTYIASHDRCLIPGVDREEVLLSDLPYIPPGWSMVIEILLVFIVARKLLLERKLQKQYFDKLGVKYNDIAINTFGLTMVAVELVDCAMFGFFRPNFRLAFIPRCGFMYLLPAVRRLALCTRAVLAEFLSIAVFYAGTIVFFAWIVVVVYDDIKGEVNGKPINKGMDSFRTTLNTMFIAGSTDEFLDCFLLPYTAHRVSGILWIIFLVIVQVLLLNLVLDTLVAAYTRYQERTDEAGCEKSVEGILEAFHTLSEATGGNKEISRDTFMEFAQEFTKSPNVRAIPAKNADIVFQVADKDGSGRLDEMEFFNICGVIQYDFWSTLEDSPLKQMLPSIWNSAWFQSFRQHVKSGGFDIVMNWVLIINLMLVITETAYDLNNWTEPVGMRYLELSFSIVYVFELSCKLSVMHFKYYWSWRSNQFDFFTTWLLLASSVLDEIASSEAGSSVKRYMNILRLLRLLRVLKQLKGIKKVQLMVETICNIVSKSRNIMTLLWMVTFFFAMLSVQLWGGILYKSNPALEDSEYKEKGLFVLNFNDFGTAFGVWVVSLLCEYVPTFPDAIWRSSDLTGSWLIFLLFYIVGVSIVFELVKAFTIEAFLEMHNRWDHEEKEFLTLKQVEDGFKQVGLVLHYRAVGNLGAHEKIMKALESQSHHSH